MLPRRLRYSILFLLLPVALHAQFGENKDSLVRLLRCDRIQQMEVQGHSFRKAIGNVCFEHNNTKLLCDSSSWDVDKDHIKAMGHVKILQNNTVLTSDSLHYYIKAGLAEFRGSLVQLWDKDKNTLRTRNLDYFTKDSMAVFREGGAFRDKDGQIIESVTGVYDSKIKLFHFSREVNMYTDSVFVKTDLLDYNTETSIAVFGSGTHAWRGGNMLSAGAGSYDRAAELFTFTRNVHLLTQEQEAWSDTLVYDRAFNNAEMFGKVELLDTTRNVTALGGYMQYVDSLQKVTMRRNPSVIGAFDQGETRDTVYVRGDEIIYWTTPKCVVPEGELKKAETRLKDLAVDPVTEYRRKAYEAAKAAAEEARRKMEEEDPGFSASRPKGGPWVYMPPVYQEPDTLKAGTDSLAVASDSTRIGFLKVLRNVKVFRRDMQVVCDSLEYNDLDSLVRLYRDPIVWNEIRRQYSADSITVALKNKALDKASLMSNAFIVVKEDSLCYDQIRGAEMLAFFDSTGALNRFDSMGGASGLFFLEEKGAFATVNKFEAKMLTATFVNGAINDLNYFEAVKSDAYPAVQLKKDERILKGFEWQPEKRPKSPEDVVSYTPRQSERRRFENVPRASFPQTEMYFPGHIAHINKMLAEADSLRQARRAEREAMQELERIQAEEAPAEDAAQEEAPAEEVAAVPEAGKPAGDKADVPKKDVPKTDKPDGGKPVVKAPLDSLKVGVDSLKAGVDSVKVEVDAKAYADSVKTARMDSLRRALAAGLDAEREAKKAAQAAKKAARDSLRQAQAAKKEAKWAALDAKDAEKAAKKAEKATARMEVKIQRMLKAKARTEARENKFMERYKARYEKKKARQDAAALKRQERKKK